MDDQVLWRYVAPLHVVAVDFALVLSCMMCLCVVAATSLKPGGMVVEFVPSFDVGCVVYPQLKR